MADHIRKRIRAAALAALTSLTTTGANAFASRVHPLQDSELPGLRISTPDEQVVAQTFTPNTLQERTLQLVVEACVKAVSGYEDTADLIVKEVETALAANQTLGGLCHSVQLREISTELSGDAERPIAAATMTFDVVYYTTQSAPDTAL